MLCKNDRIEIYESSDHDDLNALFVMLLRHVQPSPLRLLVVVHLLLRDLHSLLGNDVPANQTGMND